MITSDEFTVTLSEKECIKLLEFRNTLIMNMFSKVKNKDDKQSIVDGISILGDIKVAHIVYCENK